MGRTFVYSRQSKRCFWNRFKNIRAMLFTKAERRRIVSFRWADHEEAVHRVEETTLVLEITRAVRMCSVCWLGAGALSSCRHFFPRGVAAVGRCPPATHVAVLPTRRRRVRLGVGGRQQPAAAMYVDCSVMCTRNRSKPQRTSDNNCVTWRYWRDVTVGLASTCCGRVGGMHDRLFVGRENWALTQEHG